LRATLAAVSGDEAFARQFFDRHIEGREPIDFVSLFEAVGLSFERRTHVPSVGPIQLEAIAGRPTVVNTTLAGTPVYEAGLHRDATVISLGGAPVRDQSGWDASVSRSSPGTTLELVFESRGTEHRVPLVVGSDP